MATLDDLLRRPGWMAAAACRGRSDVSFVDVRSASARARAFTICGSCEVRQECLDWAVHEVRDFNRNVILGGHDGPARRRLAQRRGDH